MSAMHDDTYYADTEPCPACGEDVTYDTRRRYDFKCEHCNFTGPGEVEWFSGGPDNDQDRPEPEGWAP